jgi:hypothetical protein
MIVFVGGPAQFFMDLFALLLMFGLILVLANMLTNGRRGKRWGGR